MQKFLLILTLIVLTGGSVQALPPVDWRFSAFPLRTVFHAPDTEGTNLVLKVERVGNMPVTPNGFLACGPDGTPITLRVVSTAGTEVVLILEAPRSGSRPCAVYYGAIPSNEPAHSPVASVDQTPVAVGFVSLQGRGIPTSWERLRHMLKTPPSQIRTPFEVSSFSEMDQALAQRDAKKEAEKETKSKKERHRNKAGVQVAVGRSYLLCPREGAYRFALDCRDAGFVVVDDELVAAWPGEHEPKTWQLGAPVSLKAGVHRVEVFNAFDSGEPDFRAGWMPPGGTEVLPLAVPDLIASREATDARAEKMNRTLQPGFTTTPVQAYSFRGNSAVFMAMRFTDTTENWMTSKRNSLWRFGDGTQSEEPNPIHVYKAANIFKATLEVRDTLGFVASYSGSVDSRQMQPEEFAVSFELAGLPAVCLGRDQVVPRLRIEGQVPANVALDVNWEIHFRSGVVNQGHQEVVPQGKAQFISLAPVIVDELETLRWSVQHRQVQVGGELIKFVRPPFGILPTRVEGDRLYAADNTRLVLVPGEGLSVSRHMTPIPVQSLDRLVCIDDTLAIKGLIEPGYETFDRILARLLTGRIEEVRYAALPDWGQFPESYGSLRKLVDVPAALKRERADIAILSIGLKDILEVKDVDFFERQAAALSDIVATSMNLRMVWVTPPPYPSDPDRSRVFAAAIRRVAESRGIPVADLFTVFSCVADRRHVFFKENPLMMSDQGHRLAGQQIVRALMGE